jgi:hypothetical protein
LLPLPRLVRKAEAPETPEALVAKSAQNNALGQVLYSVCSWFAAGLTLLVCYARMIADRSPSCHESFGVESQRAVLEETLPHIGMSGAEAVGKA